MVKLDWDTAAFFLNQHAAGANHMRNAAKFEADQMRSQLQEFSDCEGISFQHESAGALHLFFPHVSQWIAWQSDTDFRRHSYTYSSSLTSYLLRHEKCERRCRGDMRVAGRVICSECRKLLHKDSVRKQVVRFVIKKFAAEYLHTKLFRSEEEGNSLVAKMKADPVPLGCNCSKRNLCDRIIPHLDVSSLI